MKLIDNDLILEPASTDDLDVLNAIHQQERQHFSTFEPKTPFSTPQENLEGRPGSLPPGGVPENLYLLNCRYQGEIVGYLSYYEGYPTSKTVYVGCLYLLEKARHNHLGSRVCKLVFAFFQRRGFSSVRIGVSLKNWPGLAFWFGQGFFTLTKVAVSASFSAEGYGCIELENKL